MAYLDEWAAWVQTIPNLAKTERNNMLEMNALRACVQTSATNTHSQLQASSKQDLCDDQKGI